MLGDYESRKTIPLRDDNKIVIRSKYFKRKFKIFLLHLASVCEPRPAAFQVLFNAKLRSRILPKIISIA